MKKFLFYVVLLSIIFTSNSLILNAKQNDFNPREIIDLNGEWFCEIGGEKSKPARWSHKIPVPGLVDLIKPNINWGEAKYFWYKKKFFIPSDKKHAFAFIKIEQSKYGTEVWFNGKKVGNYIGCYTSSEYDVTSQIKYGEENVLLIRVGQKDTLSPQGAVGGDPEKSSFIPGIWGDVSLILTGNVKIESIQVIPDIEKKIAKARINIKNFANFKQKISISSMILEKKTGKCVSKKLKKSITLGPDEKKTSLFEINIPKMKLWSPDSPFCYNLITQLEVNKHKQDRVETVFGMREFKIKGADFYLNNKKIFLRGSNIAFHRFLSDSKRKSLVWDKEWIKKVLIDIPKEHNFNYFRNHLGQMYNQWYDIADEYGMLLQNEWLFWEMTGTQEELEKEFTQWIIDNFNHPSIIIWDILNEPKEDSKYAIMIKNEVIPKLKKIDPVRPWEYVDFEEDHPYIYSLGPVLNDKKFGFARSLDDIAKSACPTILNEFIWFWLDSKGMPTCLIQTVLPRWMGVSTTKEERLQHQAFIGSELVELFRRMRVDGIAPFVYLSINGHCTANWFSDDIKDLKPKPVLKALKNAFSPFGVSIELWDRHFFVNENRNINVYMFNDYTFSKKGTLRCTIVNTEGKIFFKKQFSVKVEASGMKIYPIDFTFPDITGEFYVKAELIPDDKKNIAISKKIAYVFEKVKPAKQLFNKRIVVLDPDKEIIEFLKFKKIDVVSFNNNNLKNNDLLVIGEGGLNDSSFSSRFYEIDKFIRNGNIMLIIEPSYGVNNAAKIKLPQNNYLMINKKESKEKGGYDSYVFKYSNYKDLPLWDGIEDEHLKMFNGGFGGIMVSDYSVFLLKPFFVRAKSGLSLGNYVIMEFCAGKGLIVISRIQIRDRLVSYKKKDSLYDRRVDPVAQQYLLNLLNTYTQKQKVYNKIEDQIKKDKLDDKKIYCSSIQEDKYSIDYALDNNMLTRWSSGYSDPQWVIINLGKKKKIRGLTLYWETAYAKEYQIIVSDDMKTWRSIYHEDNGDGDIDEIKFSPITTQYVCIFGIKRGTPYGYSLWEVKIK